MCQISCLYEPVFTLSPLSHKYAHPPLFDFLIKHNSSLIPEKHAKHHQNNKHNYSSLGHYSDNFLNKILDFVYKNKLPIEGVMSNIFRYSKEYKIKMRFVGDVEGDLVKYLKDKQLYSKKDFYKGKNKLEEYGN